MESEKKYKTCIDCGQTDIRYDAEKVYDYYDKCALCGGNLRDATPDETEECKRRDREYEQKKMAEHFCTTYTPKCPVCGSPNIHKISATKRVVSGAAFGLFSKTARSQWECSNCGNKF